MIKKIHAKEMTLENFYLYGSFVNMMEPNNVKFDFDYIEYFRDAARVDLGEKSTASISMVRVQKRAMIIENMQYHNHTAEGFMPLDTDMLIPLAPATPGDKVPLDDIQVFRVPQHTFVSIRPGVWHYAPFPCAADSVSFLVVLPERIYALDDHNCEIPSKHQIEVAENTF